VSAATNREHDSTASVTAATAGRPGSSGHLASDRSIAKPPPAMMAAALPSAAAAGSGMHAPTT
jgi:hypothetical protein